MCDPAAATAPPVPLGCGLDRELDALGQPVLEPPLRVVDDDDLPRPRLERGGDRPEDQRAAAERVQDLRQGGTHARSFAGGDDDDGGRGHRSHRSIGVVIASLWGVVQQVRTLGFGPSNQGSSPCSPVVMPFESVRARREHVFVPRYTEDQLRAVVPDAKTLKKCWCISVCARPAATSSCCAAGSRSGASRRTHFVGTPPPARREPIALEAVLVVGSTYQRGQLKQRLYDTGLKQRVCELCGQGEEWKGRRMSLILDHINGVADDNRLENLRIVCPNCNATLDTHCGRANRRDLEDQECVHCGAAFRPKSSRQRYCSRACGMRWERAGHPRIGARRVERPAYEQLVEEVAATSWSAVGRSTG